MSVVIEDRKAAAIKWADTFLTRVCQEEAALEFDGETSVITAQLTWAEDLIQNDYDVGNDPGIGEEPGLLVIISNRLDILNVPRTRAVEIIAALGIHTPGQAVMMAAIIKRLYETQTPKPVRFNALRLDCLLSCGTITQEFFGEMWDLQKGYTCGISCDNLLDTITAADLEN